VTKVLIVDDHPLIRQGIQRIIDLEKDMKVAGEASSANEAIGMLSKEDFDIAIVDISLDGEVNGIDLIKAIHKRFNEVKTIVLSMHVETIYAVRAIRFGASGYVTKKEAPQCIVEAVRAALRGELYVSGSLSGRVINRLIHGENVDSGVPIDNLSNREFEIFELIGNGYSSGDIAKKLNISVNTIESHRKKIKDKLGVRTASDLTRFAVKWVLGQNK